MNPMHYLVRYTLPYLFGSALLVACTNPPQKLLGDEAIRRVENCVCYATAEGQNLKPWELAWDEPEKLRTQFSHCVCQAHIDIRNVENPKRYIVPGTVVK